MTCNLSVGTLAFAAATMLSSLDMVAAMTTSGPAQEGSSRTASPATCMQDSSSHSRGGDQRLVLKYMEAGVLCMHGGSQGWEKPVQKRVWRLWQLLVPL